MCTKGVQSDFLLHTIRVSSMKSAILKSQIDKNSFLINVNIVFFLFMCIPIVKSYLKESIIF